MSSVIEMPATTQILEIKTEDFIYIVSILTCHGYRATAQRVPGRHVIEDELPNQPEPPKPAA